MSGCVRCEGELVRKDWRWCTERTSIAWRRRRRRGKEEENEEGRRGRKRMKRRGGKQELYSIIPSMSLLQNVRLHNQTLP